jgi:class 3 adenylate cyclase
MSKQPTSMAVLFADVCDSRRLYEAVGDEVARSHIADVLSRLARVTGEHEGSVVKSIGDELMCTFPGPRQAADAAIAMNRLAAGIRRPEAGEPDPVRLQCGFHAGPVVREADDAHGDGVNVATQMRALAKPGQILTTGETMDLLTPEHRSTARYVDRTVARGRHAEIEVFELLWDDSEVTEIADSTIIAAIKRGAAGPARLELTHGDTSVLVSAERPGAGLGRLEQNDLAIESPLVSRYHARIEYRKGRFVLVDQSSNGTFVLAAGGHGQFLRREEAPLTGSGVIGLGEEIDADSPRAVRYRIES